MNPPIEELIEIEAGDSVPDAALSLSSQLRRRFMRGEVVNPRDFIKNVGGSNGLPSQVIVAMKILGWTFEHVPSEDGSQAVSYRCTNWEHRPSNADFTRYRADRDRLRALRTAKAQG